MTGKPLHFLLGLAAAAALAPAALAQDDDTLILGTHKGEGLNWVAIQLGGSDLLGALGSLERILLANPEAVAPRLLYASVLCRLDDRQGAELEIGLLAGKAIADPDWAGVVAACGPMARPAPPKRRKK
jgi:hypothetical protein